MYILLNGKTQQRHPKHFTSIVQAQLQNHVNLCNISSISSHAVVGMNVC